MQLGHDICFHEKRHFSDAIKIYIVRNTFENLLNLLFQCLILYRYIYKCI